MAASRTGAGRSRLPPSRPNGPCDSAPNIALTWAAAGRSPWAARRGTSRIPRWRSTTRLSARPPRSTACSSPAIGCTTRALSGKMPPSISRSASTATIWPTSATRPTGRNSRRSDRSEPSIMAPREPSPSV